MSIKRAAVDKAQLFSYYWNALVLNSELKSELLPVAEYNFDHELGRKHRFDWAFPDKKIAVEIEGNAWHVAGGGRHMQDSDMEKYNIAASMGWRVFRFSPTMLKRNSGECIYMVFSAIEKG